MKIKTLLLTGVAALLAAGIFTAEVKAQSVPIYADQTLTTFTNSGGTATNLSAYVMDVRKQASVGISITTSNGAGDAVNANILYFDSSVDNGKWSTLKNSLIWRM